MNNKDDMKGPVLSAIIGAAFFAVPYVALGVSMLPALGIGVAAFGAGNLLLSDNKTDGIDNLIKNSEEDTRNFTQMINDAKRQNAQIYAIIDKIDDKELRNNITELHDTASKIIDTIARHPQKMDQTKSFFGYYLPVTLKILKSYDDIENQRLDDKESKKFMNTTENMVNKINKSFKTQLASLYQSDIIDVDAEMKVFDSLLNSEGLNNNDDFKLK